MTMKENTVAFFLFGLLLSAYGQPGGWRPSGVPSWCPEGSPRILCIDNPCRVQTCQAIPWARCINDDPCEPYCVGNFYVFVWRISERQCERRWWRR